MLYNGTKTILDWTSVHKERRFRLRDFFKGAKLPPSRFLTTGVTFWMGFYGIADSFNFVSVQYGLALRYDNVHLLQNFFILSFLSNLISSHQSLIFGAGIRIAGSGTEKGRILIPYSRSFFTKIPHPAIFFRAYQADVLRGSSRVPASIVGQERVTNPLRTCAQ